ncbi:hypothetical protein P9869_21505 [Streptomyces ossamyceticus]|nr:hypothetical protein [Streptomyces ossamyceticus]
MNRLSTVVRPELQTLLPPWSAGRARRATVQASREGRTRCGVTAVQAVGGGLEAEARAGQGRAETVVEILPEPVAFILRSPPHGRQRSGAALSVASGGPCRVRLAAPGVCHSGLSLSERGRPAEQPPVQGHRRRPLRVARGDLPNSAPPGGNLLAAVGTRCGPWRVWGVGPGSPPCRRGPGGMPRTSRTGSGEVVEESGCAYWGETGCGNDLTVTVPPPDLRPWS